jgi:hypothetical protein
MGADMGTSSSLRHAHRHKAVLAAYFGQSKAGASAGPEQDDQQQQQQQLSSDAPPDASLDCTPLLRVLSRVYEAFAEEEDVGCCVGGCLCAVAEQLPASGARQVSRRAVPCTARVLACPDAPAACNARGMVGRDHVVRRTP